MIRTKTNMRKEATARRSLLWLLSLVVAGAAVGGPFLLVGDAAALGPAAEVSVVSRATLLGPMDIAMSEPSDLEMAQLTVQPGGTSGTRRYAGPALVTVLGGTGSRYNLEEGACRATTILSGAAYVVSPGEVDEIRNQGVVPLQLVTTSLAPAGELWAAAATPMAGCAAATAKGFTVAVFTNTSIAGPARVKVDGPSDILISKIVVPPGAFAAGWHYHPETTLVSVEDGRFDVTAVTKGRCVRTQFSKGTGFAEPGGMVHEGRNDGTDTLTVYVVGISSFAGPFLVPQAPPSECNTASKGSLE